MNPEPQEVNSADLEIENFVDDICRQELKQEPSEDNLAFRKVMVHGIVSYKASQSKLPVDNGDVEKMAKIAIPNYEEDHDDLEVAFARKNWVKGYNARQSKLTGTVFVKVSVKDRLPSKTDYYGVLCVGFPCPIKAEFDAEKREFLKEYDAQIITHWLAETAAPKLYSEEQMRKCWQEGIKSRRLNAHRDGTEFNFFEDVLNSLQPKQ